MCELHRNQNLSAFLTQQYHITIISPSSNIGLLTSVALQCSEPHQFSPHTLLAISSRLPGTLCLCTVTPAIHASRHCEGEWRNAAYDRQLWHIVLQCGTFTHFFFTFDQDKLNSSLP